MFLSGASGYVIQARSSYHAAEVGGIAELPSVPEVR
jgi:hypothetical protein